MAAGTETEAVERVAEDVWSVIVPRPSGGDAARFYIVAGDDGAYLVDSGWDSEEGFARLKRGLDVAGLSLEAVRGVALTHLHPDHCGLAARVRSLTGAWVAAHPAEVAAAAYRHGADAPFLAQLEEWLPRAGVPDADVARLIDARRTIGDTAPVLDIDVELADGDTLELGGRRLTAALTPGHSVGHLCFFDDDHGLLFAGDLVLPQRLPPIGSFAFDGRDPLATFFASLARVESADCLVLPGHGAPFRDLEGESRRIRDHHERRMSLLLEFLRAGAATVWESALGAPWRRPWSELPAFAQLLGLGKVNAHLTSLVHSGRANRDGQPIRFTAVTAS